MKKLIKKKLILLLSIVIQAIAQLAVAQNAPVVVTSSTPAATAATPAPKMSRYEAVHGGDKRLGVFRRDPNIWVYTPEVQQRSGMPKEWASTELRGVAAVAFRVEPEGAEMDCGFGGNKDACRPVMSCILELYFDRNTHLLPWRKDGPVADFYPLHASSWSHFFYGGQSDPITGARARRNSLVLQSPFADPESGKGLEWWWSFDDRGRVREAPYQMLAYDQEMHGSYSFLKFGSSCTGGSGSLPKDETIRLQWRERDPVSQRIGATKKDYHEIYLPPEWTARMYAARAIETKRQEQYYREIWSNLSQTKPAQTAPTNNTPKD